MVMCKILNDRFDAVIDGEVLDLTVCINKRSALSFVLINNGLKSTAASLRGLFANVLSGRGSDFRAYFIFNGLIY